MFPIKKKGLVIYRGCFKKRGTLSISIIFILTNPFLSVSGWCVCDFLNYTISISILCVSWEEPSLNESDQQICDFYKSKIFESKDTVEHCKINFLYQQIFIQCDTDSCCEHIKSGENIYLYGCVGLLDPECVACQIRILAKNHIM